MKKKVVIAVNLSVHVGSNAYGYECVHEWYRYGDRNQEGDQIF